MNLNEKNIFSQNVLDLIYKTYETHDMLNKYYFSFWKNIFYNDSYILYKIAILTLKDMNYYIGFNRKIQKYLYTGKCEYIKMKKKNFFEKINSNINTEYFCKLIKNIIYLLDQVFEIVPKTPSNLISYRMEYRDYNDEILDLEKGDLFYNLSFLMTSIYPLHIIESSIFSKIKNKKSINFIFIIPKDSKAYYIYNPWVRVDNNNLKYNNIFNNNKNIVAHQENELVLPRGCYWYIIDKILLEENEIIYIMYLVEQPINKILNNNEFKLKNQIIKKKIFSNKIKINFEKYKKIFENEIKIKLELKMFIKKYQNKINIEENIFDNNYDKIKNILKILHLKKLNNEKFKKEIGKIVNLNKIIKEIEIKKDTDIEIFISPSNFNFYIYFYNEILKNKNKITINFPFLFYLKNSKNDFEFMKLINLYISFPQYEIYNLINNKNIKNLNDIKNNILVHSKNYPLFYILNIKLKNNIKAYDLYYNYYYKDNPLKKYLYFNSSNIIFNNIKKIFLGSNRYFCIINGTME
jgi:hypothetical protein